MQKSFDIEVKENIYSIKPHCEPDCTLYEVYTACDKLFTLKLGADGEWKIDEAGVIGINHELITDIGEGIEKHLVF